VRATSRALGVITESSQRFQRGADPEMCFYAINRAAALIQEVAQGEVAQGLLDAYPNPIPQRDVSLRFERCRSYLGAEIDNDFQKNVLQKLGFELKSEDADSSTYVVPTWRHDVSREVDLIEEVGRLYNYDNLPYCLPSVRKSEAVFAPAEKTLRKLRHHLVALGLTECYNWTFSSPKAVQQAQLSPDFDNMVALQNPLSENYATMRATLIPGLLQNVSHNVTRGARDLALFEMGPVYRPKPDADERSEQFVHLAVALSGARTPQHWDNGGKIETDFYDIKGILEEVSAFFGVELSLNPEAMPCFQKGQSAQVILNDKPIGRLGKVGTSILKELDVDQAVYLLEIGLTPLLKKKPKPAVMQPIPSFPASIRDMAVVVEQKVAAGDLVACAQKSGGKLLQSVSVFDVYTGEHIAEGQKSVALSLKFQSQEKTLTDNETQKTFDKILKQLQTQYGAALR
jgi:phenylalanyl-tRNA synthetase beta chain